MKSDDPASKLRAAWRDVLRLVAHRSEAERRIDTLWKSTIDSAEREYAAAAEDAESSRKSTTTTADKEFYKTRNKVKRWYTAEHRRTEQEFKAEQEKLRSEYQSSSQLAKKKLEESKWIAETVYEAKQDQPGQKFRDTQKVLEKRARDLRQLDEQVVYTLIRFRQTSVDRTFESASFEVEPVDPKTAHQVLESHQNGAAIVLENLKRLSVARLFAGLTLGVIITTIVGATVAATGFLTDWRDPRWFAGAGGGVLLVLIAVSILLFVMARRRVCALYTAFRQEHVAAEAAREQCLRNARAICEQEEAQLLARRDYDIKAADEKYLPILEELRRRRSAEENRINETYPKRLLELKERHDRDLQEAEQKHRQQIEGASLQHAAGAGHTREHHQAMIEIARERRDREWGTLESEWKEGMTGAWDTFMEVNGRSAELFPPWQDAFWNYWEPPREFAPVLRFGEVNVDLAALPGGMPHHERLQLDQPSQFILPALLDFPSACSVLVEHGATGRTESMALLQLVMLRLLTSLPPGKVRFNIIDPIGLGQSFAGFMHLADYQEALVGGKIWTEPRHIEQRLADLTEHMENVIQKYLRNEFETITQYNEQAGEIAEPFRFLVIADLPVNLTETAAQRLTSILNSGRRCGVYTLISRDTRQTLPKGFELEDLRQGGTLLTDEEGVLRWHDADFGELPLRIDPLPSEAFLTGALRQIGHGAGESSRVEVPFDVITPEPDRVWSGVCDQALTVPLGRAGATKLQQLELGRGTAQHALVAGKTGSGKSTLLHVLVTNLAQWYSPDEVEFYLVDFKKGVEFKTYATHDLPHARVVAIESDREFGLSVLQRLDVELKRRGDLYRSLGVQDLAAYRQHPGTDPMPRTLLIIDEFQELFVEDDRIGQEAALLLDRLVRQGRAFGIHVLLGSQTLGGAYSLARSTLEQMAVRIALQCSEADSYLIFSDDNNAARLLARPGEAIYNDAGGNIEGNSPFQVCWLPEAVRESYLERVASRATELGGSRPEPLIVFEGNAPALLEHHRAARDLARQTTWPLRPAAPRAWLGEAIAIKEPTAATFARQSGSNLLIVGQRDEAALAMLEAALISLALQLPPDRARFFLLDATPADSPLAGHLARLAESLPHVTEFVAYRDVSEVMLSLDRDCTRRREANETDSPAVFLFIVGLQRFRMLRRVDEFSFSMDEDAPPSPDRLIVDLLRDGPVFGIHTLTACDTASNLERTFDRQTIREFEQRVLFQMSVNDSSNLIDSPAASKLGLHRALYSSEEIGVQEKFRPYALPDEDTWAALVASLQERARVDPFPAAPIDRDDRTPEPG